MKREQGSVILLVLLVSAVFAVLAPVAGTLAMSEARIARSHAVQTTALYIAEAGVELALARLGTDNSYSGDFSGQLGGGSFTVSVTGRTVPLAERSITSIGSWGGGQQLAAARVTFTQDQASLQSFLFQHTFLAGGTVEIRGSTISGPVRVGGLNEYHNFSNKFINPDRPVIEPQIGSVIPAVYFSYYQGLATANPSLWHVTTSSDLDQAINNAINPSGHNSLPRQRILVNAGNDKIILNEPVNFSGLIVIQASEVRIKDNINAAPQQNNPLVILTTGDIVVPADQGHRVDTLGNNTLLYSNGKVKIEHSEGGGVRQMKGIVVAKGDNLNFELGNTYLAYNNAMLHLLEQDAQEDFRQEAGTVMNVTFIDPQP